MNPRILLSLPTLVAALAFAPGAHAAQYVSSPPLSPSARVSVDPHVLVAPSGERILAWTQNKVDGFSGENVSVRTAPPGGDFGETQTFPATGFSAGVQAAVGADGTVALAWTDATTNTIHIARRAPGQSSFTDATPLKATNESSFGVELAVTGGDAYVSFQSFSQDATNPSSVWVARLAAGDTVVRVVPGTGLGGAVDHAAFANGQTHVFVESPKLAIENGQPVVTWQRLTDGTGNQNGTTQVGLARGSAAGTMSGPVNVIVLSSNGNAARSVDSAIASGGGHTYVLWPNSNGNLVFRDVAPGGGGVVMIPADTTFEGDLLAKTDASGALIAAWEGEPTGSNASLIESVVVPAGAAPPQAVRLTPPGAQRRLDDLAVASDGSALAIFDHESSGFGTAERIDGSLRVGDGAFGPVESISGLQDVPREPNHEGAAAVLPGGRALALWSSSDHDGTEGQRLHLSERDTAPPTLDAISAPADATVGEPAQFTASASDALSGASVSWDFGDGSEADGDSVSHTFGSPGAVTVSITATDGAGNIAQQTRVVAVAPAPTGPGPQADHVPPVLSHLSLTHRRFRVGRNASALRLTLSERSTLVVSVERRRVVRGTLVRASARRGAVKLPISGRFDGAALAPGAYTATVSAIDGSGNRSATHRVKFTIVRR